MTIYLAMYTPCIYESAFTVISPHKTEEGAVKAMLMHKQQVKEEHDKLFASSEIKPLSTFDEFKNWKVTFMKLQE